MSQTIATTAGRIKLAQARAGIKPLPKAKYIALGSGGAESDGTLKTPNTTFSELYGELFRREITEPPTFPAPTTARYNMAVGAGEYSGKVFNEIGLYDEENTLIAIKTFLPMQKSGDMEMIFEIDDIF